MLEKAFEIMSKINEYGYEAYIVGGYVRDIYLSRQTSDIDICTSATPKELIGIFENNIKIDEKYGSVKLFYKNDYFDITTFRKDYNYKNNRKPSKIEYVKSLEEDLTRRDFTINTLCMNKEGKIIDLLNAQNDLRKKVIKTVNKADISFKEDALRMLRAIRFATILNFKLDREVIKAIKKNESLISELSTNRKKEELQKILSSDNYLYGIKLLNQFNLYKYLGIKKIKKVIKTSDVIGMWAQINFDIDYPFTKLESDNIKKINEIVNNKKIDNNTLYKYGNYICLIAAEILKIDKVSIISMYNDMPIKTKEDINFSIQEICKVLKKEPSQEVKNIFRNIEFEILNNRLQNKKLSIKNYLIDNYKEE